MVRLLTALILGALLVPSTLWAEVAQSQKVLTIRINAALSSSLKMPGKWIKGEIPIFILSDREGRMSAIQVNSDRPVMYFEREDSSRINAPVVPAAVKPEILRGKTYTVQWRAGPISRDLFAVNASGLDPVQGGLIRVSYLGGLFSNNEIAIRVIRVGDRWLAKEANEEGKRYISSAEIRDNGGIVGFANPEFRTLDPNEIAALLNPTSLQDPRATERRLKDAEQLLDKFEREPISVEMGQVVLRTARAAR